MRKPLILFFSLLSLFVKAQTFDPVDINQITVATGPTGQTTPALFHTSTHYGENHSLYPLMIFCHGLGESGGPASVLYNNQGSGGPSYFIAHGQWPSSFHNYKNNTDTPIMVLSPWQTATAGVSSSGSISGFQLKYIIAYMVANYRVDPNRIYLTGLSAGGQGIMDYMGNVSSNSDHGPAGGLNGSLNNVAACIPMSAEVVGGLTKQIADTIFNRKGVGLLTIGSPGDVHADNTFNIAYYYHLDTTFNPITIYNGQTIYGIPYAGGHCCWGGEYTPTMRFTYHGNSINIYSWALEYNLSLSSVPVTTVSAGSDQSVQLPTNIFTFNGSAIPPTGHTINTHTWSQISGPNTATITIPGSYNSTVTNLIEGVYIFRLTVVDDQLTTVTDDMTVTVLKATGCGGIRRIFTITADLQGKFFQTPAWNPGDTIVVMNTGFRWAYFTADGVHGTASCPIVIINGGGQVRMQAGLAFSNSTYVHVTGTGDPNTFYGFYISAEDIANPVARSNCLQFNMRSAFCEIDHIDEYAQTYCMWLKNEVACQDSINNWRLVGFSIHDIRAKNINQDGFYLGSTSPGGARSISCSGVNYFPLPSRLGSIHIYNIILDSVGRTGIQMSGADSGFNEINNCRVTRTGYEINPQQGSGIIAGGYSSVYIHDNYVRNSYQHNISYLGAGLGRIENNDLDSAGHIVYNGVDTANIGFSSISSDTRGTTPTWPNTVGTVEPHTPTTALNGVQLNLWVRNNKTGLTTNTKPPSTTLYNIDIGAGFNTSQPWGTNNIVCNNTLQNGQPAIFSVSSHITYSTDCSGTILPPTVSAGSNQSIQLPLSSTTLFGVVTQGSGLITSIAWTQISGPNLANITSPNAAITNISGLITGVYSFKLTANDANSQTAFNTVAVTVTNPISGIYMIFRKKTIVGH